MPLKRTTGFCLLALLCSSCAPNGAPTVDKKPLTFCEGVGEPLVLHQADYLSDPLAIQVKNVNDTGRKFCGWLPVKKSARVVQ